MAQQFSIASHELFTIGPVPISDISFTTILMTAVLGLLVYLAGRKFSVVPTRTQSIFELVSDYIMDQIERGMGIERARKFLPLFLTMLIFIMVANQLVLIPFVLQIMYDGVPLLRTPTSTLAGPIGLSFSIFLIANFMALSISPKTHFLKFFPVDAFFKVKKPKQFGIACIEFFIGIMELVAELAKIISLAARLFGNIFAGEVMIAVITGLSVGTHFLVPIPFIALAVLAGFVQAFVFMLLSIQFVSLDIEGATPGNKQSLVESF